MGEDKGSSVIIRIFGGAASKEVQVIPGAMQNSVDKDGLRFDRVKDEILLDDQISISELRKF
jgi:hypothetical protein